MTAENRRQAYLKAIGVDVYTRRSAGDAPLDQSELPTVDEPALDWTGLRDRVAGCTSCGLHQTRTQTVFGVGNPSADWMFIGEAPGAWTLR